MNRYLQVDAGRVVFDIHALVEAFPEFGEDDALRADAIEGETDMPSVMRRLLRTAQDAEALEKGARQAASEASERARRFAKRNADARKLMLAIMDAGELQKLELPFATFSARGPQPGVVIEDEGELPQGFTRAKIEPAKAEIKKALLAGEAVPGARLELGEPTIQIRTA